jgi:prepilin-type N-terminal cleavage/methylation domain-containing protein
MKNSAQKQYGYTLVELLITLALSVIIIVPFSRALNESWLIKTNTKAMNDLQQQSRFALQQLETLITNSSNTTPVPSPTTSLYNKISGTSASIIKCGTQLISSASGNCSNADNNLIADKVLTFTVQELKPNNITYEKRLFGINLVLGDTSTSNSVDVTAKFILGGL